MNFGCPLETRGAELEVSDVVRDPQGIFEFRIPGTYDAQAMPKSPKSPRFRKLLARSEAVRLYLKPARWRRRDTVVLDSSPSVIHPQGVFAGMAFPPFVGMQRRGSLVLFSPLFVLFALRGQVPVGVRRVEVEKSDMVRKHAVLRPHFPGASFEVLRD